MNESRGDNNNRDKVLSRERKKERGRSPRRTSAPMKNNNKGASSSADNNTAHIKAATAALKPHTTVDSEDEEKQ